MAAIDTTSAGEVKISEHEQNDHTPAHSPARRARAVTHKLAMAAAAEGDLLDFVEYRGHVDFMWSAINAAIASEVGGADLPAGGEGR